MIDTVVLKLHDLQLHLPIAEYLNNKLNGLGKTVTGLVSETDFTVEQKLLHKTFIHFHDTGKTFEKAHFNELPSSHYSVKYYIDYQGDFIAFNFSVPKYLYGTNVLMDVKPVTAKDFSYSQDCSLERNLSAAFSRFITFVKNFFSRELGGLVLSYSMLEINRIDLCYNQVFSSRSEALQYLTQLKSIRKKHTRETSNFSRSWETSVMFKTKRYSFKVYHKGSEFKKSDYKKLAKKKDCGGYDLQYLQGFADRILRYEMTLRKSFISYLFMRDIFRKDCEIFNYGRNLNREIENAKKRGEFSQEIRTLSAEDRRHLAHAQAHLEKVKTFYLGKKYLDLGYDLETDHQEFLDFRPDQFRFYYPAHFSKDVFNLCARSFLKILKEFQLNGIQDHGEILHKLDLHNSRIEQKREILTPGNLEETKNEIRRTGRKISRSKIIMLLELLKGQTFEEIGQSNIFSRKTWYNYRKDLETLGLTERNLLDLTVNATFDLQAYHTEILYNLSKFPHLPIA